MVDLVFFCVLGLHETSLHVFDLWRLQFWVELVFVVIDLLNKLHGAFSVLSQSLLNVAQSLIR